MIFLENGLKDLFDLSNGKLYRKHMIPMHDEFTNFDAKYVEEGENDQDNFQDRSMG